MSLTLRLPAEDLAFKKVKEALDGAHLAQGRADGWGVRVIVREASSVRPLHTHVALDRDEDKQTFILQYDMVRGKHEAPSKLVTSRDYIELLLANLKHPQRPRRGLISAHYTFSSDRWEPTFPVPFSLPPTMSSMPGRPQIIGLDLSFAEATQPLLRVFVTTYPELNDIVVRVLMRSEIDLGAPVGEQLAQIATAQLPAFVRKRA